MRFVTTTEQRAGLLVAICSGGRPTLRERPVTKFLDALEDSGLTAEWVVRERDAAKYEPHTYPLCIYPDDWAFEYARTHWIDTEVAPTPDGMLGPFPGREWVCREAERRGLWGVLMLDDNIMRLTFKENRTAGAEMVKRMGGLAGFADLMAAVALSTNARFVGTGGLDLMPCRQLVVARTGWVGWMMMERVGPGREEWYGPFGEDAAHTIAYGTRPDGVTAAVLPMLRLRKEQKSTSGMRAMDHGKVRGRELLNLFPQAFRSRTPNMTVVNPIAAATRRGAISNPLRVKDRELWEALRARFAELIQEWHELNQACVRRKVAKRSRS